MKTRITITVYDDKALSTLKHRPLDELIDSTKETGHCFLAYNNGIRAYVEKTKAGYKMSVYSLED
jgi:hypothetical protein